MEPPETRASTGCCGPQADLTPAIIAPGHRQAAEETRRRPPISPRAWTPASRLIDAKGEKASSSRRSSRPNRTPWFLQRLPAPTRARRCPKASRAGGRHRLPLHVGVDGPQHRHVSARWAAKVCRGVGQSAFTNDKARVLEPRRRHPTTTRALLAVRQKRGGQGQHHLQDPLQTTRSR